MFVCGAISAVGRAGKALCGCICTLVVGGPILIIVGIVLLAVKNTRADDVTTFNKAVAAYNTTIARGFSPATFSTSVTNGNYTLSYEEPSIVPVGNLDGVDSAKSSIVAGSYYPSYTVDPDFSFTLNNTEFFTARASASVTKSESIRCNYERGCSAIDMETLCKREHNGAYYTGGSCSYRSSCGKCSYSSYLSKFCVVVDGSYPRFIRDRKLSSCFYPFSTDSKSNKYENSDSGRVTVSVRHSSDPFIVLQRITEGSMDFGITEAQQKGVGTACLIIGILMVVASCLLGVCLFFMARAAVNAISKRNEGHQSELINHGAYSPNHLPPPGTGGAYPAAYPEKTYPQQGQGYAPQQGYPQQYPPQPQHGYANPPLPHHEQPYMGQPTYNQMPPPQQQQQVYAQPQQPYYNNNMPPPQQGGGAYYNNMPPPQPHGQPSYGQPPQY